MATKKPLKTESGQTQEFGPTDTIPVNNLASAGSDGDVLTKDSTDPNGKKWSTPSGGSSNNPLMVQIFS